ncbi:MAG TPA: hypothetical protein VFW35_13655 [Sphingomicrobium sp.]|nr:hypothetical protein [Sphingomicrobium sp.]
MRIALKGWDDAVPRTVLLVLSLLAALAIAGGAASAQPAQGNVIRTFCYEKLTNASTRRSTIYFTNVFLLPRDRALSLLGELAGRMTHDASERLPGPDIVAAKPVCSLEHQGTAEQDLEETIGIYRRDPMVTIARITWDDF